jgi:membrane protein YqaA with SNARE-associated domain
VTDQKTDAREIAREVGKLEREAAPPSPELPVLEIPEIPSGRIYIFLLLFYGSIIVIRLFFVEGPSLFVLLKQFTKPDVAVPRSASILLDYFLYLCLCCQFIPLPTIPAIALTAKVFHPIIVSIVGAVGTAIANLNDYAILGWLFRNKKVKKVRDIHSYRRLLYYFDKKPFLTLTVGAFLPIPIDVIRLMAISRAYATWKYMLAAFVGRVPRYLIIAYLGKELSPKYILILFGISVLPAIGKFVSDMMKKRKNR